MASGYLKASTNSSNRPATFGDKVENFLFGLASLALGALTLWAQIKGLISYLF